MLSRLASRGSYGWLFAGGLVAGIAIAIVMPHPTPKSVLAPTYTCVEPMRQAPMTCSPQQEAIRATAVIHYFENEVELATAADPASAKAAALLALPLPCGTSEYAYPALTKHFESAAMVHLERGDRTTAAQLVAMGRSYGVDIRVMDAVASAIAARD